MCVRKYQRSSVTSRTITPISWHLSGFQRGSPRLMAAQRIDNRPINLVLIARQVHSTASDSLFHSVSFQLSSVNSTLTGLTHHLPGTWKCSSTPPEMKVCSSMLLFKLLTCLKQNSEKQNQEAKTAAASLIYRFTPLKNKGVAMPCCVWAILTDCFPLNTTPVLTEELSAPPTGWCVYKRTTRRNIAKQKVMRYVTVYLFCLWWASIIHKKSFRNIDFLLKILEISIFILSS